MPTAMSQQFRALLWKNYLIKRLNLFDSVVEGLIPVVLTVILVIAIAIMKSIGQTDEQYIDFFENLIMRAFLPLLSGNCCRFVLN